MTQAQYIAESQRNGAVKAGPGKLLSLEEAAERLSQGPPNGGGLLVAELPPPSPEESYRDRSTVLVCPTRGFIDTRVLDSWQVMIAPPNQKKIGPIFARGYEVGKAYSRLIANILEHEHLRTWKYVLTLEDDNIIPPDAHIRLLEVLESHPEFDAVAGLYHMKDAARTPMAYGDAADFRRTGKTNYWPLPISKLDPNGGPVEVCGIPMGCTLWRMDLFREVPPSHFVTLSDWILTKDGLVRHDEITVEQSVGAKRDMTQDMAYCEVALGKGKRFAVVPSVPVGHLDAQNGMVY